MTTTDDIRRAAGRVIVAGFEGKELPDEIASELREERLGGVILFRRNILEGKAGLAGKARGLGGEARESAAQVAELCRQVHAERPPDAPALPVSIDQEGGPVARLRGVITDLPPMAHLGAIGDAELCTQVGEMVGAELWSLGINLDFAPVMDVATEPDNPVIGVRAFSDEPANVARLAGAFALGLLLGGAAPCGKHFPGHGDTRVDSHVDLPVLEHDFDRLDAVEWVPFRAAVRGRLPMIMTAHVSVPALDRAHPATFSERLLTGCLRRHLGFSGIIISDDLEMAAVADRYEMAEMAELGLRAGLDAFLVCHRRDRREALYEALVLGAERDSELRERLGRAAARMWGFRTDFLRTPPLPDTDWERLVGCPEHRALADQVRERFAAISVEQTGKEGSESVAETPAE